MEPRSVPYLYTVISLDLSHEYWPYYSRETIIVQFIPAESLGNVQHIRGNRGSSNRLGDKLSAIYGDFGQDLRLCEGPAERGDRLIGVIWVGLVEEEGLGGRREES